MRIVGRRGVALLIAALLLEPAAAGQTPAAQVPTREPAGAVRVRGEVYLNRSLVTGDLTVFAGDTLQTGPDGAAGMTVAGRGTLAIGANTEITFTLTPRFFASLQRGSLGLRSIEGGRRFPIRIGDFVVLGEAGTEAAAEIERVADGSARVTCTAGSIGVIALEGPQSVFLRPGETAIISAQGALSVLAPGVPPTPAKEKEEKRRRAGLWILLAAAGGGTGAAVALSRREPGGQPVSPSGP